MSLPLRIKKRHKNLIIEESKLFLTSKFESSDVDTNLDNKI